jgi:hypothetical protein
VTPVVRLSTSILVRSLFTIIYKFTPQKYVRIISLTLVTNGPIISCFQYPIDAFGLGVSLSVPSTIGLNLSQVTVNLKG